MFLPLQLTAGWQWGNEASSDPPTAGLLIWEKVKIPDTE